MLFPAATNSRDALLHNWVVYKITLLIRAWECVQTWMYCQLGSWDTPAVILKLMIGNAVEQHPKALKVMCKATARNDVLGGEDSLIVGSSMVLKVEELGYLSLEVKLLHQVYLILAIKGGLNVKGVSPHQGESDILHIRRKFRELLSMVSG